MDERVWIAIEGALKYGKVQSRGWIRADQLQVLKFFFRIRALSVKGAEWLDWCRRLLFWRRMAKVVQH